MLQDRLFKRLMLTAAILTPVAAFSQDGEEAPTRWTMAEQQRGYVVFEHNPMATLAASHVPDRGAIIEEVSCSLAGGEYESVQIGVHALADTVTNISIEVQSDLDVTIYHRISPDVKQELAKAEMSWMSWMDSGVYLQRGDTVESLEKGQSVNFWLTFRADEATSPGLHTGEIRIQPAGKPATMIRLKAQVRPFRLQAPRAAFGMYFREDFLPQRFGSWSLKDQDALAIYRDMAAHGQNSVSFYGAGDFSRVPPANSRLAGSLAMALEVGLVHPETPCMALQGNIQELVRTRMQAAEAAVVWLDTQRREQGWPEIMWYGWDEPPYPAPGLREDYGPLRELPSRLSTAMSMTAAYAHGDLHDVWIVHDGHVTSEMQAEAQRLGAQVWTYSYRILREGFNPLRQRYYAGLYTWAHELGGNFVWAYSHGHHGHAWWLPGGGEPMPITGWEARREGVDDYRYLQMLEYCVKSRKGELAIEAAGWLEALRVRLLPVDPHNVEAGQPLAIEAYDRVRARAAGYIEKLQPPADRIEPWPVTYLKNEAAAFRGKSVNQCIAALGDDDPATRRGAAWALFELVPQGPAAVSALVDALDDPTVRIPALRALEVIGPDAYTAVPQVSRLLSHSDAFVRLGATFTLAGIARPRTWHADEKGYAPGDVSRYAQTVVAPLRQALRDSTPGIVEAAAHGLFCCGGAAAPALPDAMEMIGRKDGQGRAAGLQVLSGMGPAAAAAGPHLIELYAAAKGEARDIALTLAAIGPAASDAVAALQQYRTPENPFLVDTCYALFCIRGGEAELQTMAKIIGDTDVPRGNESGQWRDAVRYLVALGAKASPVVPLVRERMQLPSVEEECPAIHRRMTLTLTGVEQGREPLRLTPR